MSEVRAAAFVAHSAARDTNHTAARATVRAAGHAAATVHVANHASHAADYAITAAEAAGVGIAKEREWQYRHLPEHLRSVAFPD